LLFLEETHEDKRGQRDRGLEAGQWILDALVFRRSKVSSSKIGYIEETLSLLADDIEKLDLHVGACAGHVPVADALPSPIVASEISGAKNHMDKPLSCWRQGFTKQVKLIILSYGILAL